MKRSFDQGHEHISLLAYFYWQERGCPLGSPEIDWFRAVDTLGATPEGSYFPLSAMRAYPDETR